MLPVHEMVRRGASHAAPGAFAIVVEGPGSTTYTALLGAAEVVARRLAALGVRRGHTVAMVLPRSPDVAAIALGVLIAGGAYAPLPTSAPQPVLLAMLECAKPTVLVAEREGNAWSAASRVVSPEELLAAVEVPQARAGADADVGLDDPAMVLFTSGSTGVPKGVIIPHRAVSNHMLFLARAFPLEAGEGVLARTHLQYVDHIRELFYPWSVGKHAVLAGDEDVVDPARLLSLARRHGVAQLHAVPTVLRPIVDAALSEGRPEAAHGSLRTVFVSGEAVPRQLVDDFHRAWPGAELVNVWGCTEVLGSTYGRIARGDPRVISVGTPTDNVQVSIVDEAGAPVGLGCVGELVIAGANVALGYIGRPDLTAANFSLGGDARGRQYRTGDFARWLPSGEVFLEGRADSQVKIRGQVSSRGHAPVVECYAWVLDPLDPLDDNATSSSTQDVPLT
jgi:enterobactin synthetase component F